MWRMTRQALSIRPFRLRVHLPVDLQQRRRRLHHLHAVAPHVEIKATIESDSSYVSFLALKSGALNTGFKWCYPAPAYHGEAHGQGGLHVGAAAEVGAGQHGHRGAQAQALHGVGRHQRGLRQVPCVAAQVEIENKL